MNDAAQPLDRAHQLIEDGDLEAAQDILATIRDDYEDDPDFWWVYAHAVEDETEGREALERVQTLNPDYPGLDNLSQQMSIEPPSRIDDTPQRVSAEQPPAPPDLPTNDFFGDEFDDFVNEQDQPEAETESSGGNRTRLIGLVAVVVIVIVAAVFLLSGNEQPDDIVDATSTSPGTQVVQQAVTEDVDAPPTQSPVEQLTAAAAERTPAATIPPTTDAETDSGSETLADALAEFNVPSDGIRTEDTSAGTTLVITICAAPGPQASTAISDILDVLADRDTQLDDDTDAVGFAVTDCDSETVIRVLALDRETLQDYVAGDITGQDVQRQIRPVN